MNKEKQKKNQNSNIALFTRFSLLKIYLNLSQIDKIDSQSGYWCVVILGANIDKWVSVYYLINAGAVSSGQVFFKSLYYLLASKLVSLHSPNYGYIAKALVP